MIEIEYSSSFDIIENYFFETLKKNKSMISDQDVVNIPFKYMIQVKAFLLYKTINLTSTLKVNKDVW
jgi:hypothetical protein